MMIKKIITKAASTVINLIIIIILVCYFLISSSLLLLSIETEVICDRLESNYVICEQKQNRLDHLLTKSTISYRLQDVNIKGYSLYLETDRESILYYSDRSLYLLNKDKNKIRKYLQGNGNPKFKFYIDTPKNYFNTNLTIVLTGWVIIIAIIYPIFKKIN